jgi:hypothetical protein
MNSTSTSNVTTASCVLEEFVPWSPSCPSAFIAQYKANSMAFAIVYAVLFMLHGRNFAVRLVKGDFEVKVSNSIMIMDIAFMLTSLLCMIMWSNYNSIHHNDSCIADVAGDLRVSFAFIAM